MFDECRSGARLLSGKRILVTGGGTGLGASMAHRFAALGASLVLVGRREAVLRGTAAKIHDAADANAADGRVGVAPGVDIECIACDIRDPEAVASMAEAAWVSAPVDVLVNNAAATFIAQSERLSPRAADAILAPTLHGALYCTLEFGRRWIDARHRGVVLCILSTSTITGRAFTVPSAMAKSAQLAMIRSLAVEWGPKGVRLVGIAPGLFPTEGAFGQLRPGSSADAKHDDYTSRNPLRRVGRHTELADLASFLVSDRAAYINGESVTIDGGMHLRTSGADELLGWSDSEWQAQRSARGGRS